METVTTAIISIDRFYNVPPQILFDAWVKPALLSKWLVPDTESKVIDATINLRAEGSFSIVTKHTTNNEMYTLFGEYIEIKEPDELLFTLLAPQFFRQESTVHVFIMEAEEGSNLHLVHTGIPDESFQPIWETMLRQLALTLENW